MKHSNIPVSVLMPVYNQSTFVRCAIQSLLCQTYTTWELLIVDDGSTDGLHDTVSPFLADSRIRYLRNEENRGLGFSLNRGLDAAKGPLIAYLPADDIYFENHLETLVAEQVRSGAGMVYSGVVYNLNNVGGENDSGEAQGQIEGYPLQLVQVLHRKTDERWTERGEFVTDDLDRMFWNRYRRQHPAVSCTRQVTCEWVSHLYQRHRIMNDREFGGMYMYKTYYGVKQPIRFQSTKGSLTDEVTHYAPFRKEYPVRPDGLKILLVGELSYNPERITSLEARGHKLYGLWINNPYNFNSVGHFPFGRTEEIPFDKWEERVREIKPDIIYALTNFKSIDLAYHVLKRRGNIPFVWHFKEGPIYSRSFGLWNKLIELYEEADGSIYINETIRRWFALYQRRQAPKTLVFDSDLPPAEWFKGERSPLLSDSDGEMHTVIAGRLLGIGPQAIETLAAQHIHLHVYGDVFQNQSRMALDEAQALAPGYVHLHPNCPAEQWVSELSQYDAGWLHYFSSSNQGNLMRANWIDINCPARMATYAVAGLPMIMHDNTGHLVHHQQYLETHGMAVPIASFRDLGRKWADRASFCQIRENVWRGRDIFCFDHYADRLVDFFREIIANR